jgi:hypothetical protein
VSEVSDALSYFGRSRIDIICFLVPRILGSFKEKNGFLRDGFIVRTRLAKIYNQDLHEPH